MLKVSEALSLIQNTASTLGDGVEFKYNTRLVMEGYEELKISLKSPNLKYRHIVYAPGGDSIFVRCEIQDEYTMYFSFSGEKFYTYPDLAINDILSWAKKLGKGEVVEISDTLSQNYINSKGLNAPVM